MTDISSHQRTTVTRAGLHHLKTQVDNIHGYYIKK